MRQHLRERKEKSEKKSVLQRKSESEWRSTDNEHDEATLASSSAQIVETERGQIEVAAQENALLQNICLHDLH